LSSQNGWRWCHKCQGFFFSGNSSQGVCPAGTSHDASQSGHYAALLGDGIPGAQSGWRWCKKCQGFFFSLNPSKGVCPADHAAHDDSASGHYSLQFGDAVPGTQGLWRWCHKCQGLFFSGHPSVCPASGSHDGSASGPYGALSESDPCEPLRQEFLALEKKIQQIQASPDYIQGPHDPHPGKPDPDSLAEVKALWPEVTAKIAQWTACELTLPGHLPDSNATFSGTATLTTSNSHAPGPFVQNVSISLLFHEFDHTTFDVTNFPAIVVGPFPTPPAGSNTTTITLTGNAQGTDNPTSGFLQVTMPLHFQESNFFAGDSDITSSLSTEIPPGSRMDATGHITIAGTSIFQSGFLGGDTGTLVVKGTISPHP